jgi:uncharacterized protein YgiM (DUF1202 family)
MKSKRMIIVMAVMFALLLQACGGSDTDTQEAIETFISQTQQISALETAAAGGSSEGDSGDSADSAEEPDSGEGEDSQPSSTPTITSTPTPDVPMVSVSQNTNCRTGPAIYYGYKTTINAGDFHEVVGVHAEGNDYAIVDYGGGATCWLWLQYADNKDFSAYNLTSYNTPPTPTPTNTPTQTLTPTPQFDWNGVWQIWVSGTNYVMNLTQSGNSVSGSLPYSGHFINVSGSLNSSQQEASGTWEESDGSSSGTFQWRMRTNNLDQFQGNVDGSEPWCGARNGAGQPATCYWP